MLNKQEVFELLSDYDTEQVKIALSELELDPNGKEFPEDIVQQVEAVLKAMGMAKKQQALKGSKAESSLAVKETAEIAKELLQAENVYLPQKVLVAIAMHVVQQSRNEAQEILDLADMAFTRALQKGNVSRANRLMELLKEEGEAAVDTLSIAGEQAIEKMIPSRPKTDFDADAFIRSIKEKESNGTSVDVNPERRQKVNDFFNEVWGQV